MDQTRVDRIVGRVLCYSTYECRSCHKTQDGTGFEIPIDTHNVNSILKLASITPSGRNMPIGWASFYDKSGTVFQCSTCNNEDRS